MGFKQDIEGAITSVADGQKGAAAKEHFLERLSKGAEVADVELWVEQNISPKMAALLVADVDKEWSSRSTSKAEDIANAVLDYFTEGKNVGTLASRAESIEENLGRGGRSDQLHR